MFEVLWSGPSSMLLSWGRSFLGMESCLVRSTRAVDWGLSFCFSSCGAFRGCTVVPSLGSGALALNLLRFRDMGLCSAPVFLFVFRLRRDRVVFWRSYLSEPEASLLLLSPWLLAPGWEVSLLPPLASLLSAGPAEGLLALAWQGPRRSSSSLCLQDARHSSLVSGSMPSQEVADLSGDSRVKVAAGSFLAPRNVIDDGPDGCGQPLFRWLGVQACPCPL